MSDITRESLKAKLTKVFVSKEEGGEYVVFSKEALAQMNAITERLKEESGFSEAALTAEDYEVADQIVSFFTPKTISGRVENGVLLPCSDDEFLQAVNAIKDEGALMEFFVVFPVMLVAEVANEVRAFYR